MIVDLTGYEDHTGVCDRLWQVSFCATVAHLRNDRTLLFREKSTTESPFKIADILEIKGFEINQWDTSSGAAEYQLNSFNSTPTMDNVGKLKPSDLIMSDESFLSSWIATYRFFCPQTDIQKKIENISADKNCVGLHIRFTDKIKENPSRYEIHPNELRRVEKRTEYAIKKVLKKYSLNKVYLASDCSNAIRTWRHKLESSGVTVLLNKYAVYDDKQFRQTSSEDFLIDLFSLSRCSQIVGSVDSGVPWTAARIGGIDEKEIVIGRHTTRLRGIVRGMRNKSKLANFLIEEAKKLKNKF